MLLKILCLSFFAATSWAKENVRVSVFNFPPHIFSEGKMLPAGPGVEFIQTHLLPSSDWNIEWRTTDFVRILEDLKNNKSDVALYFSKNPEREKMVNYSDVPLFSTESAVIVKSQSKLDFDKEVPVGLKLSRNIGTVVPESFEKAKVIFEELRGDDIFNRSISLIRLGRVEGYYIPTILNATYELSRHKLTHEFKVLQVPGQKLDLYVIFRKGLPKKQVDMINANLQQHRDQYPKILQKKYPQKVDPEVTWKITQF